ncbi:MULTISPECIES: DUF4432 family protein [Rhizobium/Agrobacterium group]|uniref:DUF4432 family protein n=1 Tax=Agrobacterium tumefaciens TaxID=358 RepID=K7WN68_AGRTU|nr:MULTISPECIES: DUF4432 family protein [Rhizobium/Agrobacterium group]AFX65645.1 Hypothetical protein [Agrobacterium radiobacter]KEA02977.1 hypothetical protein CN09_33275 [Rhizobium rhizogenes]NTI39032.1 DUF4432 family protein [Rhizobium rhizogenes]NTI85216.1 DUF4432 family protein [Rhizobium rhizogenes]NTJ27402.1 DUF4432 family protein [Rhizobium rhizogenes]
MDMDLLRRTPDLRAVADIRLMTLEDGPGRGQRLLVARNSAGIGFEIAVDRGFDISVLSFKGTNIGWNSPTQMTFPTHDPDSEEGWGFFRNFDGFMVTCGLDHYSRPHETDVSHYNYAHIKSRRMPHHGRIATEKARLLGYGVDPQTLDIVCEGVVRQASVFGETLELRRKITLPAFGSELLIEDTVTNRAFRPTDHAIMYHLNFGYPFLDDSLTIGSLPDADLSELNAIPPVPQDDFGEKVDVIDSRVTPHKTPITLANPTCGVAVSLDYNQACLPKLAVWRAYQSGVFALGIEPRTDLRPTVGAFLQPGESRSYALKLGFASF